MTPLNNRCDAEGSSNRRLGLFHVEQLHEAESNADRCPPLTPSEERASAG